MLAKTNEINSKSSIASKQYIRREQDGECRKCIRAWRTYPLRYAREGGYRSYLRSNGVQLPTLLINPPPHRSTAWSIVSRFHSQPHRRPSVRQRYLRGISPPAYYVLHYRLRSSESRSVYTRGNHSASFDSILHFALRVAPIRAIHFSLPFFFSFKGYV